LTLLVVAETFWLSLTENYDLLEFEVLKALNKSGQTFLDVSQILWITVDQFSGIEYEEFPARIAEVAMWLIDHQMNMLVSSEFGQYFVRLPLKNRQTLFTQTHWKPIGKM
jgi:hypothetical protein